MRGLRLGLSMTGGGGFAPSSLFTGGTVGVWYDPSDLSTMWQDSAGTTAAAVNSPVGKINDKSGGGNHLLQATSSKRPILRQSGSLYYLEFDGVDDFLISAAASVTLGDGWASTAAYSNTTRKAYQGPWKLGNSALELDGANRLIGEYWDAGTAASGIWIVDRAVPTTIFSQKNDTGPAINTPMLTQYRKPATLDPLGGVYWGGASAPVPPWSGGFGTRADSFPTAAGYMTVGVGYNSYSDQKLYGLALFDRDLTVGEASQMRTWMGAKAGLTL